ncbi:hypothetical protein [Brevibacillus daliensis]|uniref:hypothetical protein n=1 Tax=Brevibacillus daliensis TaxID=2892995 RepID=UPI001E4B89AA|nr:hypothetical protein [Brevibacillus daliensis]
MTYNLNTGAQKRKKPFEPDLDFVKVHRALYTLYTQIPGFTADHVLMYIVLMDYYNTDYGYAFPTKWQLALRMNCGENKPSQTARLLESCGLIKVKSLGRGKNHVYYVYAPITDPAKFYERFPEVKAHYDGREAAFEERRARHRAQDEEERVPDEPIIGIATDGTPITSADFF